MIATELEQGMISGLMEVSKAELGSDYLVPHDFEETIGSDSDFCFVAMDGGEPIGFAICNILGPDRIDPVLHLDDPERGILLGSCPVGYIASVSVDDRSKGRGAGSVMVSRCMEEFAARGVDVVCAMAWKSVTGRVNIAKVLERNGLRAVKEVFGYWNDPRAFPDGHDCPVCGNPCSCSAVLYVDGAHTSMFPSTESQKD